MKQIIDLVEKENKSRNYKNIVACELCGKLVCKAGWKQRRCKVCVPTKQAHHRASRYGISQSDFEKMLSEQSGLCALCLKRLHTSHINGLHVDHDHVTNKVRGLLCGECNHGLGHIERLLNINKMEKIMSYLGKTNEANN